MLTRNQWRIENAIKWHTAMADANEIYIGRQIRDVRQTSRVTSQAHYRLPTETHAVLQGLSRLYQPRG